MTYEQKVKNLELELQHCKAYISKQLVAFQEKLNNTIGENEEIIRQKDEKMEKQRGQLRDLTEACSRNRQNKEALEATIKQQKSTMEQKDNAVHNLSIQLEQQKADIAYFQQAAMNSNNTVNEQKNKIERYQQRIIQLENENARFNMERQNGNRNQELREAKQKITSLEEEITTSKNDRYSLLGKIDSLKKRNGKLEADLQKANSTKNQSEQVDREAETGRCYALIAEIKIKQDSLSKSVNADMVTKDKFVNYLELMIERLEDIIRTMKENKNTTDYSRTVAKLEKEINEFREKEKKVCSICYQPPNFVKCKDPKCGVFYHGECIHQWFVLNKSAAKCIMCTKETIELACNLVHVETPAGTLGQRTHSYN